MEVTRGPEVESRHRGQIVVADATGKLHHQIGDPEVLVCLRSLAKPFHFQAQGGSRTATLHSAATGGVPKFIW
ncbi:MAG: asparaginase [Deltaproteobacteria bacterium]|nr:asparaginase [Deltaproteobacteria bacterium]